jgi:two-component system response regulator ArlR
LIVDDEKDIEKSRKTGMIDVEVLMAKTILIIDDNQDWVRMLSLRFQHEGFQVEVALDALQGVSQALNLKPDLVLLDIMMPAGSGINILSNIRKNTKTFNLPVIVVTGKDSDEVKNMAEKLGISGYFLKPILATDILQKINEVLDTKKDINR